MLNDPRSHGLWEKTAPPPPVTGPLAADAFADVVVVGGGFTGISAALHLAEAGRSVILLEGAEIGFGGAGRNVGLINAGMWVMPDDLPGELGDVHGERLLDLLGNGPRVVIDLIDKHAIACELERNGTLHCAVGDAGLRRSRTVRRNGKSAARRSNFSMRPRPPQGSARPPMPAPCSTDGRAPCSRSPMCAAWRMRPSAPALSCTLRAGSSRRSGSAVAGRW